VNFAVSTNSHCRCFVIDHACTICRWSHRCWCDAWKRYVARRPELSTFDDLGSSWVRDMTSRACQLSQAAYETRLSTLLLDLAADADNTTDHASAAAPELPFLPQRSWWRAEFGAWKGGTNVLAHHLNVLERVSYHEGFSPLPSDMRPPDRPVSNEDAARLLSGGAVERNSLGLMRLQSWAEYYRLRDIAPSSPAALLLTFPLTLYWSIVEYGEVPCTVAHAILKRPLRIHIVGAEKELFFLDMFQETSYLLGAADKSSSTIQLELVVVVRTDMVPPSMLASVAGNTCSLVLNDALTIRLVCGTYGHPNSLDPHFDCGSGPPDMVLAFNAGLYAYESWRSVVTYLHEHSSVVGVFTDYNEMSAAQCASLGGAKARASVTVNPFRQPRAMPVRSMNLPQFTNGFCYVYNQLPLE
jgi:hypothetical protein